MEKISENISHDRGRELITVDIKAKNYLAGELALMLDGGRLAKASWELE